MGEHWDGPEAAPMRILLIEDNPADARLIQEYLAEDVSIDFELRWIDRLGKIETEVRDTDADVVLLDLFLPDSEGTRAIALVRKALPAAAVVVLTGHDDQDSSAEAIRYGAQDHLLKSDLHPAALVKSIRLAEERKRREQELARSERELALVSQLMLDATEAADFESAVARVLDAVCRAIDWAGAEAWIAEEDGTRLVPGPVSACCDGSRVKPPGQGEWPAIQLAGWDLDALWANPRPIWISDLRRAPFRGREQFAETTGLSTAVIMPVMAGTSPAALLVFYHADPLPEDPRLVSLLSAATAPLGIALKRRRTEDMLRRSEAWLTRLLDTASDGICVLDEQSRITYTNGRACDLLDRRGEEVLGRDLMEFVSRDGVDRGRRSSVGRQEPPGVVEVRARSQRMSEDRWLVMSTSPIIDDEGVRTGSLVMLTDITRLKTSEQAEAVLADAGDMLSSSLDPEQIVEGLASLMVPAVSDWCAIVLASGSRLELASIQATDPGKAAEVSQIVQALIDAPGDDDPLRLALHQEVDAEAPFEHGEDGASGVPSSPAAERVQRIVLMPLSVRERAFGVLLLGESAMHPEGALQRRALARELTRRAAMAVENAHLYQAVQQALRNRDEVLGVVAHDLRNPLSAISMYAALLEDASLGEGRDSWVRAIQRSADHMDRLIQDLVDIARLESGTLRIEKLPTHIPGLLGDIEEMFGEVARERGVRFDCDAADLERRSIWADPVRLKQVLANLVGNALKFTPSGGSVSVSARADGEVCVFTVRDTGTGIDPEHLPHLFERFWQPPGSKTGAGLGLAIANGLTELHGGQITVESESGKGTVFRVELPGNDETGEAAQVGSIAPAKGDPTSLSSSVPPSAPRTVRVLIADDHEIFLSSLEELLREAGTYQVVGRARTSEEAVEKARLLSPDLVLMDLDLPVQGGLAAIRQITKMSGPPAVLAVSGNPEEVALVSAVDAGARGYVVKSASPADLLRSIEGLLNHGVGLSPAGQRLLAEQRRRLLTHSADNPLAGIREQERMILALAAAGFTSAEIGKRLFLSPKTVDSYRSRLMRSLGLRHRSELVHLAIRSGLLTGEAPP